MQRRRRSRGQAMVEFALVFPIFALILFGIIDMGRYVVTANALSNGAREAARAASVGIRPSPQCDGLSREACAIAIADSNAWFVSPDAVTTTVSCERPSLGGGTTAVAVSLCKTNDFLTVHSSSQFTLITPLIAQFMGNLNLNAETKVVVNQ
jgi:Flp pilus assembly protein TadG